jgi:hypothetical protein
MPTPQAEKAPDVPEVSKLRIQNALLQANLAQAQYDKTMAALTATVRAEIAAFEEAHKGWTVDAGKLVAVKKPEPKK